MTEPDWSGLCSQLATALDRADDPLADRTVSALVDALDDVEPNAVPAVVLDVLALLRRHRRFALLERVGEAVLQIGDEMPTARRQYAQALIERGAVVAGLDVLSGLLVDDDESVEALEARGLQGRAFKEMFVGAGEGAARRRERWLNRAVRAYAAVYGFAPDSTWHGINTAALLLRAARDDIAVRGFDDPHASGLAIAAEVAAKIERRGLALDPWDWTTAVEADVALGDVDGALARLNRQEATATTGAFELASLLRQLVEVWQMSHRSPPGATILPPLEALLLQKQGAVLTLGPMVGAHTPTVDSGFEKVFGAEGAQTQAWFEDLLRRCRGVARVEDAYDEACGTAFVVAGGDLHPSFPALVLVTNAHVIPDAVSPQDALVTFRGLPTAGGTAKVPLGAQLWTSPPHALDATVVGLTDVPPGVEHSPLADRMPLLDAAEPARVYVVGHPLGASSVKISIHDNDLLAYDDVRAHYRAPTQPGSSGSPVFDKRWRVLALHHAGSDQMPRLDGDGFYAANEGIRMDRIRAAIATDLSERGTARTLTSVRVQSTAHLPSALATVLASGPHPVVVLVGGAGLMSEEHLEPVSQALRDRLLPALERWDAVVVDGGTDAGVMRLVGRLRESSGATFPLVGVVAQGTVAGQEPDDASVEGAELEPHHSLVVVVPGDQWGDESPWLGEVAEVIAGGRPTVTLMVNGGEIARDDVARSIEQRRPLVVLGGTGRLADAIAAAAAGDEQDERASTIAASPHTTVVDLDDGALFTSVLDEILGGATPSGG